MMEMIDFTQFPQNIKAYGGAAGRKLGIVIDGQDYIIKFPGNLKEKNLKNIKLSYSNSPVCEYIGSRIYESIGIPVHETKLGYYNDKVVVGCKDFLSPDEQLIEFEKIKVTFLPHFFDSNGDETNGTGVDLKEILLTIEEHPFFERITGVKERFWDMFVGDAIIGNPDRNNGNWGVIKKGNELRLAPVYDNGNCLNNKWHDERMAETLKDTNRISDEAYRRKICVFEMNSHHVKPYELIASKKYKACNEAVKRIVPRIDMKRISHIIDEIPCISDIQKTFYKTIIMERCQKVLLPTYAELVNMNVLDLMR